MNQSIVWMLGGLILFTGCGFSGTIHAVPSGNGQYSAQGHLLTPPASSSVVTQTVTVTPSPTVQVSSSSTASTLSNSSPQSASVSTNWVAIARPVYAPSANQTYASWWQEQFGSVDAQGILFVVSEATNEQPVLFTNPSPANSPPQSVQALIQWFDWMSAHQASVYYLTPNQAQGFPQELTQNSMLQESLSQLRAMDHGVHWANQQTTSPDDANTNDDLPF